MRKREFKALMKRKKKALKTPLRLQREQFMKTRARNRKHTFPVTRVMEHDLLDYLDVTSLHDEAKEASPKREYIRSQYGLLYQRKDGMYMTYKPTIKQLKLVHYEAQGHSRNKAKVLAGYSPKSSNKAFSPKLQEYLNVVIKSKLRAKGVTEDKIADKLAEWLDATKETKEGEVSDYETQMKAYDRLDKIMGYSEKENIPGKHQKMTIESWTFGEDQKPAEENIEQVHEVEDKK